MGTLFETASTNRSYTLKYIFISFHASIIK